MAGGDSVHRNPRNKPHLPTNLEPTAILPLRVKVESTAPGRRAQSLETVYPTTTIDIGSPSKSHPDGKVRHMAPPAKRVSELIDDLFEDLAKAKNLPLLVRAAIVHFKKASP